MLYRIKLLSMVQHPWAQAAVEQPDILQAASVLLELDWRGYWPSDLGKRMVSSAEGSRYNIAIIVTIAINQALY